MKKIGMKTWQISLVLLLSALLPICFVTALARSNPVPHSTEHHKPGDFWPVSLKPVKITEIDGRTFYWEFQADRYSVEVGSFYLDERVEIPKDVQVGKIYLVDYCATHNVAYAFHSYR